MDLSDARTRIAPAKVVLLFAIFFLIACGLGYPILSRFDPRQTPGLSDVKIYAAMVSGSAGADAGHMRFRVFVPWIAKSVYRAAKYSASRTQQQNSTWDPVLLALLVADSLFVAATAVLIALLGTRRLGNPAAGLVGALLYLVNFAVSNTRLVGLVDAGEGFFLLALLCVFAGLCSADAQPIKSEREKSDSAKFVPASSTFRLLPCVAVLGTLTKESFIPFSIVFTATWWLAARRHRDFDAQTSRKAAGWIVISWLASLAAFLVLHRAIEGSFVSPFGFGLSLHHGDAYLTHLAASLADHQLWYIFGWLVPLSLPNLSRIPRPWMTAIAATCIMAFVLDAFYGGAPGTVGRALFSIAGPVLSLSSALLLLRIF